jgi:hypothetical protein
MKVTSPAQFPSCGLARQQPRAGSCLAGRPECVGPLSWKDKDALKAEIDDFKAALNGVRVEEAFLPCASIGIIAQRIENKYYRAYEVTL